MYLPGMAWKKGDLGRFKNEDPNFPRFEVLNMSEDRSRIAVWYNADTKPTLIPFETFKRECVNWWIPKPIAMPAWVQGGALFRFKGPVIKASLPADMVAPSVRVRQPGLGYAVKDPKQNATVIVEAEMTIRSIRNDYACCATKTKRYLLQINDLVKYGVRSISVWTILADDHDPLDEPDDEDFVDALRG